MLDPRRRCGDCPPRHLTESEKTNTNRRRFSRKRAGSTALHQEDTNGTMGASYAEGEPASLTGASQEPHSGKSTGAEGPGTASEAGRTSHQGSGVTKARTACLQQACGFQIGAYVSSVGRLLIKLCSAMTCAGESTTGGPLTGHLLLWMTRVTLAAPRSL